MKLKFWFSAVLSATTVLGLAVASPAFAQTQLELARVTFEITPETSAVNDKKLVSYPIEVLVDYRSLNFEQGDSFEDDNLHYRIYYNGIEKVNEKVFTHYIGEVSLQDLDSNNTPEVIIRTYSGGAHCCTNFAIYSWQNNQFTKIETGLLDSYGGEFRDLDENGSQEFLALDNAFLYQFSSYAASFPPSLILSFKDGELKDVTRQYPKELRAHAWQMYQRLLEAKNEGFEVNGILAGYVAQKILLKEYQQGWDFMLTHYDRTSNWGLEIYRDDRVVGSYPDFPTALKAFLLEQGYLD